MTNEGRRYNCDSLIVLSSLAKLAFQFDFLPLYFSYTGLDKESLKDVISLAKEILEKDYDLYDESPQNVSAGIIHYFMNINGAKYSANITKNIGKSNSTILSWSKKIAKIHNS